MTDTYKLKAIARFHTKYTVAANGCWLWNKVGDKSRYGSFSLNGSPTGAHRASYLLFVGDIPEGENVCHTCDHPACVNPAHLFAATQMINIQDSINKGIHVGAGNRKLVTLELLDETIEHIESIQKMLKEHTGEIVGFGRVVDLIVSMVLGNFTIEAILEHYDVIKDTILLDEVKIEEEDVEREIIADYMDNAKEIYKAVNDNFKL